VRAYAKHNGLGVRSHYGNPSRHSGRASQSGVDHTVVVSRTSPSAQNRRLDRYCGVMSINSMAVNLQCCHEEEVIKKVSLFSILRPAISAECIRMGSCRSTCSFRTLTLVLISVSGALPPSQAICGLAVSNRGLLAMAPPLTGSLPRFRNTNDTTLSPRTPLWSLPDVKQIHRNAPKTFACAQVFRCRQLSAPK
jgi:hypothetical protein